MAKLNLRLALVAFLIICIFTALDYAGHKYLEKNNDLEQVPGAYYKNKVIFGSLLLFIGVFVVDWLRKKNTYLDRPYYKASVLALFVILLLQLRYLYQGYFGTFHLYVIVLHYFALMPLIYFTQKWRYLE